MAGSVNQLKRYLSNIRVHNDALPVVEAWTNPATRSDLALLREHAIDTQVDRF
jgi:hypothetical protein